MSRFTVSAIDPYSGSRVIKEVSAYTKKQAFFFFRKALNRWKWFDVSIEEIEPQPLQPTQMSLF